MGVQEEIIVEINYFRGQLTKKTIELISHFSSSLCGKDLQEIKGEFPRDNNITGITFKLETDYPKRILFLLMNFLALLQNIPTPIMRGDWVSYKVGDCVIAMRNKEGSDIHVEV